MGRALRVHPVVVLVGVAVGGVLAGVVGAVVATPLLAAGSGMFGSLRDREDAPPDPPEPASGSAVAPSFSTASTGRWPSPAK